MGYGGYVPRYRLTRREFSKAWGTVGEVEEKAVPGFDEDVLTMAAEACFNALDAASIDPSDIDGIFFASSSAPHVGDLNSAFLAAVLGLREDVRLSEFTGVTKAGTMALWNGLQAVLSGSIRTGLVVASEHLLGAGGSSLQSTFGAGAAAFLLGHKEVIAHPSAFETFNSYFPYRWRNASEPFFQDYGDPRFEREYGFERHVLGAVNLLADKTGVKPQDCHHVILPQPDERLAQGLMKRLQLKREQVDGGFLISKIGDTGAALPLMGLVRVLDAASADETILMGGYSTGAGCDLFVFKTTERIKAKGPLYRPIDVYLGRKEYVDYPFAQRLEGFTKRQGEPVLIPTSLHGYWRSFRSRLGFIGGRCRRCGAVNYPVRKLICMECHEESKFDEVRLNRRGEIYTIVSVHYAPSGVEGPYAIAVVDVGDGVRVLGRMADCDPDVPKIGAPVEIILRKLMEREGLIDYGYAFRPLMT